MRTTTLRTRLPLLCFTLLAACSAPTGPGDLPVDGPLTFSLAIEADPNVTVASTIPVTVRVLQQRSTDGVLGAPTAAAGQLVNFVASDGGSVFVVAAFTNELGEVLNQWTLGTVAGVQRLEARTIDQVTGEAIVLGAAEATAAPGPVASLIWWTAFIGNPNPQQADSLHVGDSYSIAAHFKAFDQYQNPTTDFSGVGYALWTGCCGGEPVAIAGESFTAAEPFNGWLYVFRNGVRIQGGSAKLVVL